MYDLYYKELNVETIDNAKIEVEIILFFKICYLKKSHRIKMIYSKIFMEWKYSN